MTAVPEMIIADIENGMIARIRAAMDAGVLGYKFKKLDTYGGEFSEGIEKLVRSFPAALVVFSGATRISKTNNRTIFAARFGVLCCSQNLRSEQSARQGVDGKPGSYKIALDIVQLLMFQKFGLEIAPLTPDAITPLFNDKTEMQLASIYVVEFSTTFEVEGGVDGASLDDFETFHANWDVPAHGNVEPPLPADAAADATDHVTLEIAP